MVEPRPSSTSVQVGPLTTENIKKKKKIRMEARLEGREMTGRDKKKKKKIRNMEIESGNIGTFKWSEGTKPGILVAFFSFRRGALSLLCIVGVVLGSLGTFNVKVRRRRRAGRSTGRRRCVVNWYERLLWTRGQG